MKHTLDHWIAKIEQSHPQAIQLGLERVNQIASILGLLEFNIPVITVGGTNGKGSCVKFLESILTASGYRVGTYTSPHLLEFNERIRMNHQNVSHEILCQAFEVIEATKTNIPLTFFEYTTLSALWIFKQAHLDVIILEIGMGGRLDAVNVVKSDIAIVTSVALDHLQWLGKDRKSIGFEKSGIFKLGKIAICGDPAPPKSLLQQAKKMTPFVYCLKKDFNYTATTKHWAFQFNDILYQNLPLPTLSLQNAAISLAAIVQLKKWLSIERAAIEIGLKQATLWGRFQIIDQPYPCILDVAHNPAAAKLLAKCIKKMKTPFIAVVGMLSDKDIANTLKPLTPYIRRWHLSSLAGERGASAIELAKQLEDFKELSCYTHDCVRDAFYAAANSLHPEEKILVFGSFYTVAEVLPLCHVSY